jgi:hypothetical protein
MNNKHNCDRAKDLLLEEIQDGLTGDGFDIFIEKHLDCREELMDMYKTWNELDGLDTPEPSHSMDVDFYAKLAAESAPAKSELTVVRRIPWFRNIAVAASIFMVGALAGFYLMNLGSDAGLMAGEVNKEDKMMLVSNSSMTRLENISEMKEAPKLNDKIINALNQALINDPNVNVRLSAIEAMLHYADNPKVRANLIKAIPYQDSPIIQLTLAEVMIDLEEKSSKDEWEELFNSDNMEAEVKMQLQETLKPVLKL